MIVVGTYSCCIDNNVVVDGSILLSLVVRKLQPLLLENDNANNMLLLWIYE